MTGAQARQCVEIARATIEEWKAKLLPVAGQGVVISDRQVTLLPVEVPVVARPVRTIMLHVWAEITMTQSMADVVSAPPPEYDESGTYVYPPFLVAALPFNEAASGYTWETLQEILPEAGSVSTPAGEFIAGQLWSGDYYMGTAPNYEIEIGDLQKTAVVTLYLRGRFLEDENYQLDFNDPATFDRNFNIGRRTLGTLLEGNRASPLPNETVTAEVRVGYDGQVLNVQPISRGAYPNAPVHSVFSITSISRN